MIDSSSINRGKFPQFTTWTTHFTDAGTLQFSPSRSPARHVQLVTELYLYRLCIFNKIEVSRLDSRLSSFVIISSYIHTLSWCQRVVRSSRNWEHLTAIQISHHLVRIQITFKTIRTPATKEFEEGNLNVKRTILH